MSLICHQKGCRGTSIIFYRLTANLPITILYFGLCFMHVNQIGSLRRGFIIDYRYRGCAIYHYEDEAEFLVDYVMAQ